MSDINLGKFSVVIISNMSSVAFSFSFPSGILSHYIYVTLFVVVTQSLGSLLCSFYFFGLCSLYFSVMKISVDISCSSEILSSTVSSLISPSVMFFIC